jgi:DNA-binding response OmpR family regulator
VIVDANRDAADSLAMLVQLEGFEAQAAYDVESAVQCARMRPTLAVVLDVDGSIDANSVIARLRAESGPPMRIIGMSHSPEQRVANVDAQLRKPLDPSALRSVLETT